MNDDSQTTNALSPNVLSSLEERMCFIDKAKQVQSLMQMTYMDYLQTEQWQLKREQALWAAGFRCQICNDPDQLQVHHRTYARRGCELASDLTVLCEDCHTIFHNNRTLCEE